MTPEPRTPRTDLALLRRLALVSLIFVLVLKVIGVVMRGPSPLLLDAGEYWELGGLVSQGDLFLTGAPIAYRTPGYPWLVGLTRLVFDRPLFALVMIQAMLWGATIGITAWMAVDLSRRREAGWLVLLIAAVMISSVTYVATVLTETTFVFALMLHVCTLTRFARNPSVSAGVLLGASLAMAVLIRPIAMLVWVADAIYLLSSWYGSAWQCDAGVCRKRGWWSVLVAALVAIALVTPWLVRNQTLFGKLMLTEFVGRNVWVVTFQDGSGAGLDFPNSPNAKTLRQRIGSDRWSELSADESWRSTWATSRALTESGLNDAASDRLMRTVASDAITDNPAPFAKKTLRRWVNFWRTRATDLPPQVADLEPPDDERDERFAGQPAWGVKVAPVDTALRYRWSNWLTGNTLLMFATLAATIRLIYRRQTRATGLLLGSVLCYFSTVTGLLEIPDYRYRMILEPVVLLTLSIAAVPMFPNLALSPKRTSPNEPTD